MPSGLFKRENNRWTFSGPTPASFNGYDKDHTKLLVEYIFQLTPEEQRRVSSSTGRAAASTGGGASGMSAAGGSAQRAPK
jgi:hypothetical protein